jgi:DNA-binding NtrC family response regulator
MKVLLIDNLDNQLLELKQELNRIRAKFTYVNRLNKAISALAKHKFTVVICTAVVDNNNADSIFAMIAKKFPSIVRVLVCENEQQTQANVHHCFIQPIASKAVIKNIAQLVNNNQAITKDVIVKTVVNIKIWLQLSDLIGPKSSDKKTLLLPKPFTLLMC